MLHKAAGRGQHFQAQGHSFSLYGPTPAKPANFQVPAIDWLTNGFTQLCY